MKNFFSLFCVLLISQVDHAEAKTILCESFVYLSWSGYLVGPQKVCDMTSTTRIDSAEVSIESPDSSVNVISFDSNKKVTFLPIRVEETFPDLVGYYAPTCSVKALSKVNFKNLIKLKFIFMARNQIEIIDIYTFDDLTSLESLGLDDNKIKQLNGAVFSELHSLKHVWLEGNICINKNYFDATAIASLPSEVNDMCGHVGSQLIIVCRDDDQETEIESLTGEVTCVKIKN